MKKILLFLLCSALTLNIANAKAPSHKDLDEYLNEHTLVIVKQNDIKFYDERGIKPLVLTIKNNDLQNSYLADRVVGKAAALLYSYAKVDKVYAQVISEPAIKILKQNKIKYKTKKIVKQIENRTKTGLCPMETKVLNIDSPNEAWEIFKDL